MKKMVNGEVIEMTAEETPAHETHCNENKATRVSPTEVETKKAVDKASAKTKLMAGEPLTEEEADSIL